MAATEKKFTIPEIKHLLKWKEIKPTSSKKRGMVDACIAAPKLKIQKVWCNSEKEAFKKLKEEKAEGDDTVHKDLYAQLRRENEELQEVQFTPDR